MLYPYAHSFVDLLNHLREWEGYFWDLEANGQATVQVDQSLFKNINNSFVRVVAHCLELNLTTSSKQVDRLWQLLFPEGQPYPLVSVAHVRDRIRQVREIIEDELSGRRFVYVSDDLVKFYDQPQLFGAAVAEKFTNATFHIRESGTCLAMGRPTAAVFHLMCVLEVGLDSLAHGLRLPYSEKNWQVALDFISDAIDALPTSGEGWKENKTFYSRAALEFSFFRDAWRNHTMHARAKYTESEARNILDHVHRFMEQLATRLQQRL